LTPLDPSPLWIGSTKILLSSKEWQWWRLPSSVAISCWVPLWVRLLLSVRRVRWRTQGPLWVSLAFLLLCLNLVGSFAVEALVVCLVGILPLISCPVFGRHSARLRAYENYAGSCVSTAPGTSRALSNGNPFGFDGYTDAVLVWSA